MKDKILFLDMDGTLLNDEKIITPGNEEAIRKALAAGHKIVISTGRASSSALKLAEKLKLNVDGCYAITYNGACIFNTFTGEALHTSDIPMEYVRYIIDEGKKQGVHVQTYSDTEVVAEEDNDNLQTYLKATNMTAKVVSDVCEELKNNPCKILAVDYDKTGKLSKFQESMTPWMTGKMDSFFSSDYLLEIVKTGVSKGNAIRKLCEILDIPMENTISAGDAENDISMIQTTHIGVVMKNARPSMHQYGNYITERDNNHDGIQEVIEKFML